MISIMLKSIQTMARTFQTMARTFQTMARTFQTMARTFQTMARTFQTMARTFQTMLQTSPTMPQTYRKILVNVPSMQKILKPTVPATILLYYLKIIPMKIPMKKTIRESSLTHLTALGLPRRTALLHPPIPSKNYIISSIDGPENEVSL
ncbi:hypothetical protein B0T21DRAFT_71671 [Apiosordaria backusii]|uniref:Uncharacterized protein n=1 Tax=Apiosordaria backusii TaxID=314023 RepID=A0AA40DT15_9PEZI|nr:hypothetical protein B0T21DRAFT_71671 [Apiosordaria backusii]